MMSMMEQGSCGDTSPKFFTITFIVCFSFKYKKLSVKLRFKSIYKDTNYS